MCARILSGPIEFLGMLYSVSLLLRFVEKRLIRFRPLFLDVPYIYEGCVFRPVFLAGCAQLLPKYVTR